MRLIILLVVILGALAGAQQPPTKPFLRIEAGMHTAVIWRIAVDPSQTYLITGSHDKTVKVWELKTGNLVKVLRVPIDEGNEGTLYAVAVSPDGRHVAVGGWTGRWDRKTFSLYIFDLKTGKMIKRISGLPEVVFSLSYSKDGKYFAVGLGGEFGLRIYSLPEYRMVFKDENYKGSIYGIDFSKDGKLVVSSLDGHIRLYDRGFRLVKKTKTSGGQLPYQVSFSEDGTKIAVGFADTPAVEVYSAFDLGLLYKADTSGFRNCDFSSVSFSEGYLYAGGTCIHEDGTLVIRIWEREGKGNYRDVKVSQNTILHILPIKGGVVFGSYDPAFGVVNHRGEILLKREPITADFRGQCGKMLLSSDGSLVGFGYTQDSDPVLVFDTEEFKLKDPREVKGLEKPLMTHSNIRIENWRHSYSPQFNGKPIPLEKYETSRCYTISPDGSGFVLGTEWYLRYYDSKGNLLWSVPVRTAWSVSISSNNRVVVAGLSDGTIRWYRVSDGKELLALFPRTDRKRWVLWTPEGYYVASEGGEELIGWHLNRSADEEAEFLPISKFKTVYNKPEVIKKLFTTYDMRKALELTGVQAFEVGDITPPIVSILSPEEGSTITSTTLSLKVKIRNTSKEPATALKVLVDGSPVYEHKLSGSLKPEETITLNVKVPEKDTFELSVVAQNRYVEGVPQSIRLFYKKPTAPQKRGKKG